MLRSLVVFTALANGHLRRLAVRRKLEEACWRRSHAHCRRWRHRHTPGTQTKSQREAATFVGVILPETGQFLLCSLQLWQLQRCRQTRARFFDTFCSRSTETVCCEQYVSWGSEQLQASARVKKLAAETTTRATMQLNTVCCCSALGLLLLLEL